jgi:hypothetical protein
MSQFISVDQVTLDWIKVAATNRVSAEFAETLTADVIRDEVWRHLVYQLTAQVLTERLPSGDVRESKTFNIDVPASPWQQYKRDHAASWWLRWLVRRRPPVQRRHSLTGELAVDVTRYWAYPEARVERQMGRSVRVAVLNQDVAWHWDSEPTSARKPPS